MTDVSMIEQCQNALRMMSPRVEVSSPGLLFCWLATMLLSQHEPNG